MKIILILLWLQSISCYIYGKKPFNSTLTVHLIPHSHDDVGWVKTKETYFYGQVSAIYRSTIQSLVEGKERTFVISEISFFKMWWESEASKNGTIVS